MNIVFMGTPEFAVPCLKALIDAQYSVVAVYTQPDKPQGRGYKLQATPVKALALQHDIPVFQPTTLKDDTVQQQIRDLNPDLIVVVAYGKILPKAVLESAPLGCVNVHASLLPKYRGAGPIQWSVINGETVTGVTTMFMAEGLDTGDMILKRELIIDPNETAGELHDRLSVVGAACLLDTLKLFENGNVPREQQVDALSCYAPMLDKSLCAVDFTKPAQDVHNLIRGLSPWPVACAVLDGKKVKIHRTRMTAFSTTNQLPGTAALRDGKLLVFCADKALEIERLQLEGGNQLAAQDFLRGHPLTPGTIFEKA